MADLNNPNSGVTGQRVVPPVAPQAPAYPPQGAYVPQAAPAQPVYVQQPVVQQVPAPVPVPAPVAEHRESSGSQKVKLIGHSRLFYWWPVWAVSFLLAALSFINGTPQQLPDGGTIYVHPNQSLGIVFLMTLLMVMLITNVSVRGMASVVVILSIVLGTVILAYFDLWGTILGMMWNLYLYLNAEFYLVFGACVFLIWAATTFIFDRMSYWLVTPGQITKVQVLGAASKSYDNNNLVLNKFRDDVFRHWMLGLGSGDLEALPHGAEKDRIFIPNVLFIGSKVERVQRLLATDPTSAGKA